MRVIGPTYEDFILKNLMKNKKALYILVPLVLGIWSLIIFRVFDLTQNQSMVINKNVLPIIKSDTLMYRKTEKLLLNYTDPFLKNIPKKSVSENQSGTVSLFKTNPEPKKRVVNWPEIKYRGIIANKNKRLAIIKINNRKVVTASNKTINGITVKTIYNDSVIIEKEKEFKTFYK